MKLKKETKVELNYGVHEIPEYRLWASCDTPEFVKAVSL